MSNIRHTTLEQWKYTDLAKLWRDRVFIQPTEKPRSLITLPDSAEGITVRRSRLAKPTWQTHPLLAPYTAQMNHAMVIDVPDNVVFDQPIRIVYPVAELPENTLLNYRHVIRVGQNSRVIIIEELDSRLRGNDTFVVLNTALQVELAPHAMVDHYSIQAPGNSAHVSYVHAQQQHHSQFRSFIAGLGGKFARYDLNADLREPYASCAFNGFYLLNQQQHFDVHTLANHAASDTKSDELFKGIIGGTARGVFNGKVLVPKNVSNIEAHQTNRNLLVSMGAEIDTKPELQIDSDAVKCSHGATIGQLDQQALFYLESRGISEMMAKQILTEGFMVECLDQVLQAELKQRLTQAVSERLQEGL
jgi:Fe-S cluster assembly protein SufD